MPLVAAYHRPTTIDEALTLLGSGGVALGGGTVVNATRHEPAIEVVDLQALGLAAIEADGDRLRLGASATLADLVDSDVVPDVLRSAARAELPSTLRTLATVGGTIAAGGADSVVLAALLVHDAILELAGADDMALADLSAAGVPRGAIVTAVTIDPEGTGARAGTGRTPADVPIVSATALVTGDDTRLALTGVAATPVLVDPDDPTAGLDPPGDFRGSARYRTHLAGVLAARALSEVR